ncbi:MAG: DUF4177 domain-containing protein [Alphaproteobacteria bacterium]
MKEYKIFMYSESIFSSIFFNNGKIDPVRLTKLLNEFAEEGWVVKAVERENRRTMLFYSRESFMFVLERDKY